jgi:hypothetical protein
VFSRGYGLFVEPITTTLKTLDKVSGRDYTVLASGIRDSR